VFVILFRIFIWKNQNERGELKDMLIYLFCFFISCFLIWLGENNKKYFIISKIIFLLALIIPAVLAGLRDFSIGVDVLTYGNHFFYDVVSSPNLNTISPIWDGWIEPGYKWLTFIVTKFTDDVHWFYFLIMLLQNIFVFLGFYIYKDKLPIWLGMWCYYCIFFNNSLNMIRQNFAMSILFFASFYLLNKSYIKYTIWILITLLFHKAVLSAFLLIPIHIYISKYESDRVKFIFTTGMVIFCLTSEIALNFISGIIRIDYLERAIFYLFFMKQANSLKMAIGFIAAFLPPFVLFYWKRRKLYDIGKENHFFFVVAIICLVSTQFMWIFGEYAGRIVAIFQWILLLALPMTTIIYKYLPGKQFLLKTSIACYAVYYWFFVLVYRNTDETFPYTSSFLESIF